MAPIIVGGDSRVSNEPRAMSLGQSTQLSMATLRAATRHRYTDQVSGDTYQPNIYPIPNEGGKGREKKGRTHVRLGAGNKLHLTRLERTSHVTQETPYVTSKRMTH